VLGGVAAAAAATAARHQSDRSTSRTGDGCNTVSLDGLLLLRCDSAAGGGGHVDAVPQQRQAA
jgi:hypothetical protein